MEVENKPLGRECMALIIRKMKREITPEQYYVSLIEISRKYKIDAFREVAEKYIRSWEERRPNETYPGTKRRQVGL